MNDDKEVKCPFCEDETLYEGACDNCGFTPSDPGKVHVFLVCGGPGVRQPNVEVVKMTEECLLKPSDEATIFDEMSNSGGFFPGDTVVYLGSESDLEGFITKLRTASVMKE